MKRGQSEQPDAAQLLLFDLGGVLVDYDPIGPLTALLPKPVDRHSMVRRWADREELRRLETGRCPPEQFAAAVIDEFGLRLTPEEFLAHFALWDRGPLPDAVALLRSLRGRRRLACLSNNNPVHWSRLCAVFGIDREFDATYLSHEIGVMKPDRRAYEHVLAAEDVPPQSVVFFDDNADNVAAARAVGIDAYRCVGLDAVRLRLDALELRRPAVDDSSGRL
jgi:glucose-1-phosphatase